MQIAEKTHVMSLPAKQTPKGRVVFRKDQHLVVSQVPDYKPVLSSVLISVELPTMFVVQLRNCCNHSSVFQEIGNSTGHSPTAWLDDLTAVFDLVVREISDAFERGSRSLLSRPQVAIDRPQNRVEDKHEQRKATVRDENNNCGRYPSDLAQAFRQRAHHCRSLRGINARR